MQIAMKTNSTSSGLMPILGTNCDTDEERQQYVAHFGGDLQLVADNFDFGSNIPENERVIDNPNSLQLSPEEVNPEAVARILEMLQNAMRKDS